MALTIGGGINIGGSIGLGPDILPPSYSGLNLILNLDAADYSAMPVDGSTIPGSGSYTIGTVNPGNSMVWSARYGGIFAKNADTDTDFLTFGPDYTSTSQAYTVMMVYRSVTGAEGRLLNANSSDPDWLLGLWDNSGAKQNVFFNGDFVGSPSAADDSWQFIWATYNGNFASPVSQNYIAGSTTAYLYGTNTSTGGFNGLRLFGRYVNSTTSSEVPTADVGLVKIWDSVLNLTQIQDQWDTYKTRFGY